MPKADQFNVQSDISLVFESLGKKFKMRLLISSGLIFLEEEGSDKERIFFMDDSKSYTGEDTPVEEEKALIEDSKPTEKPKKKRSKKKKK